jgi:hypothetical protein
MKRWFWILVVILSLVVFIPAGAKGVVDRVTLVGPHWYGEVEITERDVLDYLALGAFADFEQRLDQSVPVSTGYLMARFYEANDQYQPLDRVMYFPGAQPGEGVVYYLEMNEANGPYDGAWFQVRPESEAVLLNWLSEEGLIPASIDFESPVVDEADPDHVLLVGGGMLLVGLLGGMALGRRERV